MANGKGAPPPSGGVPPCQWKLHIKVHSQERFWPKDPFQVEFGPVGAADPATPLIPPINGPWYKTDVKMVKKTSPEVVFKDCGLKNGGVTARVHKLVNEKDWVLVDGAGSTTLQANQNVAETIDSGQKHQVDLFIRHPLNVYLEFKFHDPQKTNTFPFPKDFPVQVWNTSKILEKKTDEKGRIDFELDRQHKWFTLKFGDGPVYFTVGDGSTGKCALKLDADRKAMSLAGEKFFSPPDVWSLRESIWEFSEEPKFIDGVVARNNNEGKIYVFKSAGRNWVRRIGEKDAPITMTLDPHWQFNRFEFFDRYYGHSDHGHKRANIPPVLVEAVSTKGKTEIREGSGHWVLNPKSVDDSVLAVPWIRQKKSNGVKAEKPDDGCFLRFKTDTDTWVSSSAADTRKIEIIPAGDPKLAPGVDRLKYYDLPEQWESRKYWTRFGKGAAQTAKFWKDWRKADYLKSRAVGEPIIFSLDDIVLSDAGLNPLKLTKKDRFAVFYHRFKPDYDEAANVSSHGVYKKHAKEEYFSDIELKGAKFNYLTQYPNWVRLLAGVTALYDAFDKRTVSGVLGARAAVKWFDPIASGVAPGNAVGWQAAIDKTHFILEPYYGQAQHKHWMQFNAGGGRVGRFDMALIRNCDRQGAKELFVSMQYFRLFFDFMADSKVAKAKRPGYIVDAAVALMNRWNGNDAASAHRGEIVPQDAAKNLTGEVLWFVQPVASINEAHFQMKVTSSVDRASMGSVRGTGTIGDDAAKPAPTYGTALAYVLAHELGHGGSLPDEYAERVNWASRGTAGFSCNTPGDPFVDEGLYPEFNASVYAAANPPYPMMTQTVEMRNRYFWHNAEFARKFIGDAMFAKYDTFPEYKVPGHPSYPRSQYSHWPIATALNHGLGAKGRADIYLHAAGKERYTQTLIPKGPYDGILTLLLKLVLYETAAASSAIDVRDAIRNTIRNYNKRFYGTGGLSVSTDAGNKDFNCARTMFRLSPRFALDAPDKTAADFAKAADWAAYQVTWANKLASTLATFGKHFDVNVVDAKVGASGFNAVTNKYDLIVDYTDPNVANLIKGWTEQYFREMIGLPYDAGNPQKMVAGDLKAVAQAVFTKNADVKDL